MRVSVMLAALLSATVAAAGCAAYRPCPYHVTKDVANCPGARKGSPDVGGRVGEDTLGFVEFDDQGWLWDRDQMEAVLERAERTAQNGGAVIVVYVHGWHHSADKQDDDVNSFRDALGKLDKALNGEDLRTLRAAAVHEGKARDAEGASGKATVFGIYVGWRGGSLPGKLDFLTFSERKRAAHRVGHGDVSELLVRLDRIHAKASAEGRYPGLVVVGHSFGGAVVYSAIADKLQIDLAAKQPNARAGTQPLAGTRCALDPQSCLNVIGDLVVLVNPAFEASLYHEIDFLARRAEPDLCQLPVLLVVSSEQDWPNRRFFPIGQAVQTQEQGVLRDAAQKHEVRRSLGNIPEQVTHCLKAHGGQDCTSIPKAAGSAALDHPAPSQGAGADPAVQRKDPCSEPLGRGGQFGDTDLYRVSASVRPNSPVMLVRATGELIPGHDLFAPDHSRDKFKGFLVQFVHELMYQKFVLSKEKPKPGIGTPSP